MLGHAVAAVFPDIELEHGAIRSGEGIDIVVHGEIAPVKKGELGEGSPATA